ncbi:efflux transporter outer membrane subunit [Sphingobacterium faecale]|uniref:TolC family protein n=1 Tax=Sphingobacterium faecale TaxID=2803775 RepID=A0ABS1R1A1_9SPHI|nr:TolC family protein [Sphingobacterium faecale]MBL1408477.1 TolC family protein [Sphingobacterium faecale]
MKILYSAIATILFVSSCSVTQQYKRPELDLPENYRADLTLTADSIQLPWKLFFQDPLLITLIDKALENNHDLQMALKSIDQLDLLMKQAKLALLPTAAFNANGSRGWSSNNSLNGAMSSQFTNSKYIDDYNAGITVSWEADIWGKSQLYKEQARASYFGQKENYAALRTRIIAQVAQAYYRLIALDEQLKIAQENVKLSEELLRITHLQYQSGQVNSLAIEQSEAQKKTAELIVPLSIQSINVQENALLILCRMYPDRVQRGVQLVNLLPQGLFNTGVPAHLLSRRPDLKAAEYDVIALNAKTGLAKTAMYPSLSLSAQAGLNSFLFKNWFDLPGSITKNLAANLTQPIFQKKELQTAYQTAVLEQEKAAIQFQKTTLLAVAEVSDGLANYKGSSDRLALTLERGLALDKATNDALLLYKSGMATYLEVISAQNAKLQNDLERNNLEQEKLNSIIDLYRSLGGGVD